MINKTAHYRILEFTSGESIEFSSLLTDVKDAQSGAATSFECSDDFECIIISHESNEDIHTLHLVKFEEGASAAVINSLAVANATDVAEVPPPEDNEFIRSQLFLVCKGNKLTWISHNRPMREGSVKALLLDLIKAYLPSSAAREFF